MKKTFKDLSKSQRAMIRTLVQDINYYQEDAGFTKEDISTVMKVKKSSIAALQANITRKI